MSLCIAGAGLAVAIATQGFTLAWTHTIEKTEWQEDWRIDGDRLVIEEARIKGSGAGMDPPADAVLKDGFYAFHPRIPPLPEIVLRRAPQAGDWRLCTEVRCATVGEWLGGQADPVVLDPSPTGSPCAAR
jgi:hypothetical protein